MTHLKKCCLVFAAFFTALYANAQEVKNSKINIISNGGIGYGVMKNDKEPNYNLNSNRAEILVNYNFNKSIGIATGIEFNTLSGTGFNSAGNFYHERTLIKIPLVATVRYKFSDLFSTTFNLGVYAQNITKYKYKFLNTTQKNIYSGWNFGSQIEIGILFKVFDGFKAGINLSGQSDFSKFGTKPNQIISDKQKMDNLNTIGFTFVLGY